MTARSRPRIVQRSLSGRTVGLYLITFWVVLTLNFLIPRLMPGDPLLALIDPNSAGFLYDAAARQELAAYYGLDRPLPEQYFNYLAQLAQGNLGRSIVLNEPVVDLIGAHLPWTLLLTIPSLLLASLIALILGTHTGWVRGSWQDRSLLTIFLGLWNMPVFFLGLILLLLFGVQWEIFPISGAVTRFSNYDSWLEWAADVAYHLVLPMTALTLSLIGGRFLLMRNTMISVLGQEYMEVARAKGLPVRVIKYRHGMRTAMLPFFTLFSVQMGLTVTGSIFIETLFAYPGMGRMMFDAVGTRDYPVLEGAFLVISVSVLLANLAADLIYPLLDPRVQSS